MVRKKTKKNLMIPHRENIKHKYYVVVRDKRGRIDEKERYGKKHLLLAQAKLNFDNDEINAINPDKPRRRYDKVTGVYNYTSKRKPHGKSKKYSYIVEGVIFDKLNKTGGKKKVYGQSGYYTLKTDLAYAKGVAWDRFYRHLGRIGTGGYDVAIGKKFYLDHMEKITIREGILYYRGSTKNDQ